MAGPNEFGYVSIDVITKLPSPVDLLTAGEGMNEHGLTVSSQTHRGAKYQDQDGSGEADKGITKLPYVHVLPYLLGACQTTGDVKEALDRVFVTSAHLPSGSHLHWSVFDAAGDSLSIEYILGSLVIRDNREVGVYTNDPSYDWHVQNLNQYVGMSPSYPISDDSVLATADVPSLVEAQVPKSVGHGHNLIGLPGGYSPASRFVNMFYLRQHAISSVGKPASTSAGVSLITGLLNKVFIVRGTVPSEASRSTEKYQSSLELTHWATIRVPQERIFMFRSYDNMVWRRLDLKGIDLKGGRMDFEPIQVAEGGDGILDIHF
jgi:choloylglycine hydrolase